jgi:catechol 2,3-dioxygenase-like lactoylglutathione lyase family enzyme
MPPPLDRLDHVAIPVEDVASAVAWYTAAFHCRVKYQDATWALLGFGNVDLALVIPGQHPAHIGFVSPDAEKFGELKTHRDGTRSCYVRDPSGNSVEILAPSAIGALRPLD